MEVLIDQELRNLVPPLEHSELSLLEESILEEGVRDALIIWNGYIVDGHNRYDIITKHGIKDYRVIEKKFTDKEEAKIWIMKNQIGRRNVSSYLRAEYIFKVAEWEDIKRQARAQSGIRTDLRQNSDGGSLETKRVLADKLNVSTDTASRIIQIHEKAPEELKVKLRTGEATINQVYTIIKRHDIKAGLKTMAWPEGQYRIIYADPPWQYDNHNPPTFGEQSDHYPTMSLDDIKNLDIPSISLANSILFLWATSPYLTEALEVMAIWGFRYKSQFIWDKVKHVMGHYNSVRHEILLIGTKGSCQPDMMKLYDSVYTEERGGHSTKPDHFRKLIDEIYPFGPRVELFATQKNGDWEIWGNGLS